MINQTPCDVIRNICENPKAPVTVRQYLIVEAHLPLCINCQKIVDEMLEKHKEIPKSTVWLSTNN